jgi:hypothetical protein
MIAMLVSTTVVTPSTYSADIYQSEIPRYFIIRGLRLTPKVRVSRAVDDTKSYSAC